MDRRAFIWAAAAGILVAPAASLAQQPRPPRIYRIAFLGAADPVGYAKRIDALRAGLRELGYVEGRNLAVEFRWAEGRYERLPELAAELVALRPDVIVTHAVPPTLAAKRATSTIPIVMTNVGDAVANGIVSNLARPGGNVTGDTFFAPELAAKRLEVLKDVLPRCRRVACLVNPDNPGANRLEAMENAARALQLTLLRFDAREPTDIDAAFATMVRERADALVVIEDAKFIANVKKIADGAVQHRIPSVGFPEYAAAGGLIGYGVDFLALYRRAGTFVDRILKGAKPGDLPVERPSKFELVVNLATAKFLGLTVPQSLLLRADEVIQ